jgi:hypothetical protein
MNSQTKIWAILLALGEMAMLTIGALLILDGYLYTAIQFFLTAMVFFIAFFWILKKQVVPNGRDTRLLVGLLLAVLGLATGPSFGTIMTAVWAIGMILFVNAFFKAKGDGGNEG